MTVPIIGPSKLPIPPMTTMKMMKAVYSSRLKFLTGNSPLSSKAPMAPTSAVAAPTATNNSSFSRVGFTPSAEAAASLSRIAASASPMRLRITTRIPSRITMVAASIIQKR